MAVHIVDQVRKVCMADAALEDKDVELESTERVLLQLKDLFQENKAEHSRQEQKWENQTCHLMLLVPSRYANSLSVNDIDA